MQPQIPLANLPKFPVVLVIGQKDSLSSFWVSWPSNGGTTYLAEQTGSAGEDIAPQSLSPTYPSPIRLDLQLVSMSGICCPGL